jgi:adenylosuccinate lyase
MHTWATYLTKKEAPQIHVLSETKIDQLLTPETYIGEAVALVKKVLKE